MGKAFKIPKDLQKGGTFKVAPAGTYKMRLTAKTTIKDVNGTPTLVVHAKIVKGPHAGITVFENIALKKSVEWKLSQLLDAIFGLKKADKLKGKSLDVDALVNKPFSARLTQEVFNGRKKNRVATFLALEAAAPSDATDEDLEDLEEGAEAEEEDEDAGEEDDEEAGDEEEDAEDEDEDAGEEDDEEAGDEEEDAEDEDEDAGEEDDEEAAKKARAARRAKRKAKAAAPKKKAKKGKR